MLLCILFQIRDLRHENVNPLIGFFDDSMKQSLVVEFCSRRSLEVRNKTNDS